MAVSSFTRHLGFVRIRSCLPYSNEGQGDVKAPATRHHSERLESLARKRIHGRSIRSTAKLTFGCHAFPPKLRPRGRWLVSLSELSDASSYQIESCASA